MSLFYDIQGVITIPHLRIQNANTFSSPLTYGFPAITSFTGLAHRLHRELGAQLNIEFHAVGVVCHGYELLASDSFPKTFHLTRNPLQSDGSTAGFVEEGRIHLEVSLIFGVSGDGLFTHDSPEIAQKVLDALSTFRVAGGTVQSIAASDPVFKKAIPQLLTFPDNEDDRALVFNQWRRILMPGFVLISRDDLLQSEFEKAQDKTLLDTWLRLSRLNYRSKKIEPNDSKTNEALDSPVDKKDGEPVDNKDGEPVEQGEWHLDRPEKGWFVPIPVGYKGISDRYAAGEVMAARDMEVPFQFVENIYSIGEWISPLRLTDFIDCMWFTGGEEEVRQGVYRCYNNGSESV